MKALTWAALLFSATTGNLHAQDSGQGPWLEARSGMITLLAAADYCDDAIPESRIAAWFAAQGLSAPYEDTPDFTARVTGARDMATLLADQLPPQSRNLFCRMTQSVAEYQGLRGDRPPPDTPYQLDMPIADVVTLYRLGLVAASSVSCDANYSIGALNAAMVAIAPTHLRAPDPFLTSALGHGMAFDQMADARGSTLCEQAAEAADALGIHSD